MKNITHHNGKLEIIRRLKSSAKGNPRYLLKIDGFTCRTFPNAMMAYDINRMAGRNVSASIGTYYGLPTIADIHLTKGGTK